MTSGKAKGALQGTHSIVFASHSELILAVPHLPNTPNLSSWWQLFHTFISIRSGNFFSTEFFKSHLGQGGPHGRSLSRFRSIKQLRVLLLPPGQDASSSQGYPPAVCRRYPFYTPGWRETMWVKFLV